MATHVGTSGLVKVGGTTVGEVIGFSIDETQDTVEDTSKWITDENEEGSYDYDYKEIKNGEEEKHSK